MMDSDNTKDPSLAIVNSINSAIHDPNAQFSLRDIYTALHVTNTAHLLDPLKVLPLLVPYPAETAILLIKTVTENCSAKEVIVTAQEILEQLANSIDPDEIEDDLDPKILPPTPQLERIILAYACAIPRLMLSLKPISNTIGPLLEDLKNAITKISVVASPSQSRTLIQSVSALMHAVIAWVRARTDDIEHISKCSEMSYSVLDKTLISNANHLGTAVGQRVFESFYPGLVLRSNVDPDWQKREVVIEKAIAAADDLGYTTEELIKCPSIGSLILLAHKDIVNCDHVGLIQTFSSPAFTSIQTNIAFDETVAFLLKCFTYISRAEDVPQLPFNVTIPFSVILPPLASGHPDPAMRHLLFRLLAVVLSLFGSAYRLQVIEDMLTDSAAYAPQIRIAAIGLVKDSVLDAITVKNVAPSTPDLGAFGTPQFLDRLGHVLFRPDPPDLFQRPNFNIEEFVESPEPKRLVESLALYYVILQRDITNRTGIRDMDRIARIEKEMLRPMRNFMRLAAHDWQSSSSVNSDVSITFAALKTSLERVDEALGNL